jgi:DNA-directed RNA polymerase subunit alpha
MELLIERGLGYVVSDQEKREKLEVGQISVDAIFTPIKNVNFRVENMRVGKRTDFDRLFLEIETDGTINPEEAFKKSSKILVDHFQLLLGKEESVKKENKDIEVKEIERPAKEEKTEVEKMKIEDIGISSRIANILEKNNIKTVSKIVKKGKKGIIKIDGMGDGGIKEITKKLKKINVEF